MGLCEEPKRCAAAAAVGVATAVAARARKGLLSDVRRATDGNARGPDLAKLGEQVRKDPKGNAPAFWEALKHLLLQGFDGTEAAFRAHASPGDGRLSLPQLQDMCQEVGLVFGPAILKALFETRLRGSGATWSLQDFQDTLMVRCGERIRGRLQEYNRGVARTAAHIDGLLRHLATATGEENRRWAVTRFHRKLDLKFCVNLWARLQKWVVGRLGSGSEDPNDIACETFLLLVERTILLQEYELDFLSSIFERIDRRQHGRVKVSDLAVALLLLGSTSGHYAQARFIFCVFDADSDGCLTAEQILRMYCCVLIHGVIARADQPAYDADVVLGDELSLSKARRLYDFTLSILSPGGTEELYTFQEWWAALETNPFLAEELLPGAHSIMWVLRPTGAPRPQAASGSQKPRTLRRRLSDNGALGKRPAQEGSSKKRVSITHPAPERGNSDAEVDQDPQAPRALRHAERFRVQAAIRFRHAVRGEWAAVEVLQGGAPAAADDGGLPALNCRGAEDPWSDEVSSYKRRQKQGSWRDSHIDTLADWSKVRGLPRMEAKDAGGPGRGTLANPARSLRRSNNSRSLPALGLPNASGVDPLGSETPAGMASLSKLKTRIADAVAQMRRPPAPVPREFFGSAAFSRIRNS